MFSIVYYHLDMHELTGHWFRKSFHYEQMTTSGLLKRYRSKGDNFDLRLAAINETWVYDYGPEK